MNIEKMKVSEVSDKTLVNYLKNKGYDIKQSDNNKLPKTWEELGSVKGYHVSDNVDSILSLYSNPWNKQVYRTKEQAKASIALAQLSQLMFVYNKGWEPDWKNANKKKYCIIFNVDVPSLSELLTTQHFLAFKTREIRIKFLENFRDLILQAKPLL